MTEPKEKMLSDEDRDAIIGAINVIAGATENLNGGVKSLQALLVKCCPHKAGVRGTAA
jgi:hypothetical protein